MMTTMMSLQPPSNLTTSTATTPPAIATTISPAVILPGLGNNTGDYQGLASALRERYGVPSVIARVSRLDWLRNAAGLLDPNYWRGTLRPRPVLDWYLERVDEAVSEAKELPQYGGDISLIGHSAGGWLARVYMEEFKASNISLLLTLGSPLLPPPKGLPGVIDQTRGLLDYVEKYCAPAVYTPQLKYVCIAGRYIKGARLIGNADEVIVGDADMDGPTEAMKANSSSLRARFIGQGYKQVCGKADVWGDGVVPERSAHLEGALNITFHGVYHSPLGSSSSDDDVDTLPLRPRYGSPSVLEKWVHHLLN